MKRYRISFVILHYNVAEQTVECIDTIKEKTSGDYDGIVVVDNCSPDGSGRLLAEKYRDDDTVHVELLPKNLGFAKGNNVGYTIAREKFESDFICVMNNDVLLTQKDFLDRIVAEYESSHCGVIGPHISLRDGHVNFMYLELGDRANYEKQLEHMKEMYRYYTSRLYPIRNVINRTIDFFLFGLHIKKKPQPYPNMELESQRRHENIVLHGSCLIFTPVYLERFSDAFNPVTFMFREEELLFIRCREAGITNVYEPSMDVLHLEDVSTNASHKKGAKKEAFICKCQIESLGILLEEL
jgi:GT2 family glycosyltransferase